MGRISRISAAVLTACLLVLSCAPGSREARTLLSAADSLMDTDPYAALYSLMSIDSTVIPTLRKKERTKYFLLRTQAKYKCYLPIGSDTTIGMVTDYYKRKGPASRYASALCMRGAVEFERGNPVSALEDYKEAEHIINSRGTDPVASGLLHTRIAELYQQTFVNDSITVDRYRKALDCFLQSDRRDLIMKGRFSLARALLPVSPEEAYSNILAGTALARKLKDSTMLKVARELETSYLLITRQYGEIIRTAGPLIRKMEQNPDKTVCKSGANVLMSACIAYARCGYPDSARAILPHIPENTLDGSSYHMLRYEIALSEGDLDSALFHHLNMDRLTDSTLAEGYKLHLRGVEKRFETGRIRERYSSMQARYLSLYIILLGLLCTISIIFSLIYIRNIRLKREIEKCTDIIRVLNEEKDSSKSNTQTIAGKESAVISEEMLKVTDELIEAYYKYGRTKAITEQVKTILRHHFNEEGTMVKVRRIVDATYPGFLSGLETSYPSLKEKDIYIIALTACGFSTGTICALRRITESSLYVEKTRIARKIGETGSLADFVQKALQNYNAS